MGKLANSNLSDIPEQGLMEGTTSHGILARLQEHGKDEGAGEGSGPQEAHR